jgi:energy-converting hydrogenase Eha subunit E
MKTLEESLTHLTFRDFPLDRYLAVGIAISHIPILIFLAFIIWNFADVTLIAVGVLQTIILIYHIVFQCKVTDISFNKDTGNLVIASKGMLLKQVRQYRLQDLQQIELIRANSRGCLFIIELHHVYLKTLRIHNVFLTKKPAISIKEKICRFLNFETRSL